MCNDHKPLSFANSPRKGSLKTAATLPVEDHGRVHLQEEGDVADLASLQPDVEHPECLPPPLASLDRSSRRSDESGIEVESKKSIWQKGTARRFKLQGGIFLHKTPSPLKNMIVTETGTWSPTPRETSPEAMPDSEDQDVESDQKDVNVDEGQEDEPELLEDSSPSNVTLCYSCQDALLSSPTEVAGNVNEVDVKELDEPKSPALPTSRSVPSYQSKVSMLRKKFDSALPLSVSMPSF